MLLMFSALDTGSPIARAMSPASCAGVCRPYTRSSIRVSLWPITWAMGKSGTPASTCQLAKVRLKSFGLQRSMPARSQASARSRRTLRQAHDRHRPEASLPLGAAPEHGHQPLAHVLAPDQLGLSCRKSR